MEVLEVNTKSLLKEFINLPYELYKDVPVWIPPLRTEQKKLFHPQKNVMLQKCP